jgi:hypothetical protein
VHTKTIINSCNYVSQILYLDNHTYFILNMRITQVSMSIHLLKLCTLIIREIVLSKSSAVDTRSIGDGTVFPSLFHRIHTSQCNITILAQNFPLFNYLKKSKDYRKSVLGLKCVSFSLQQFLLRLQFSELHSRCAQGHL